MSNNLVSVIIPTYKGSKKIAATLEGLRAQTYERIEIIVVDDNGRGTEEQLCTAEVLANYPEVHYYVHETNRNGSAARNTGIYYSTGDYIAFLDDDDTWLENKLEKQVASLQELSNEWGAVYCPYIVIESEKEAYFMAGGMSGNIVYDYLVEHAKIASSTIMLRREVLNKVHGFDESFRRHQDWEFIARISANYKIAFSNSTLTFKHNEVRRNSPKKLDDIINNRLFYLNKMKSIIDQLPIDEQKGVYSYHYSFLAKECLRRRKLIQCLKWLNKSGYPFTNATKLVRDVFYYTYKKNHKKTYSELFQDWKKSVVD